MDRSHTIKRTHSTRTHRARRVCKTLQMDRFSDFDTRKKISTRTLKNDQRVLTAKSGVNELFFIAESKVTNNDNHVRLAIVEVLLNSAPQLGI